MAYTRLIADIKHLDYSKRYIEKTLELLDRDISVLELGSKTGRLSMAMTQKGLDVVALESQGELIKKHYREQVQKLKIKPKIVMADILDFDLSNKYSTIILSNNLVNSYSLYQLKSLKVIVDKHLEKGGKVIIHLCKRVKNYNKNFRHPIRGTKIKEEAKLKGNILYRTIYEYGNNSSLDENYIKEGSYNHRVEVLKEVFGKDKKTKVVVVNRKETIVLIV